MYLNNVSKQFIYAVYLHNVSTIYLHNVSTTGYCVDQHRGQQLLSLRDLRAAAGAGPGRGQDQQVLHPQEQQVATQTRHTVC